MTERLYYTDSLLREFQARVTAVERRDAGYAVRLDRSAFYPASGGQVCDTGYLEVNGTRVPVAEVVEAQDGEVVHLLNSPLEAGAQVRGVVDAARRFDHMQQHSGQHVLSAAFLRLFNMPTVSFHMGAESCTIDLEAKSLSPAQVERAEVLANEIVTENRPVEVRFATLEEARTLGVRKLPEIAGELRLIDIRDFDLNACGGTHVRSTGEIGAILLRKTEKVRQGVRVEFVCGGRAITAARRDFTTLTEAAGQLSAHLWELPQQVRKLMDEAKAAVKRQQALLEEIAELEAARILSQTPPSATMKVVVRHFADRDLGFTKLLAQKLVRAENAVALLGAGAGQPAVVFAQSAGLPFDMGALMKDAMAALGGRGGGTRDLAQGGVGDSAKAEAVLRRMAEKLQTGH